MTKKELIKALAAFDDNESIYFAKPIRGGYNLTSISKAINGNMGIYLTNPNA